MLGFLVKFVERFLNYYTKASNKYLESMIQVVLFVYVVMRLITRLQLKASLIPFVKYFRCVVGDNLSILY